MPTTAEGVAAYEAAGVQLAPAKACNAGGVAVSGLEMAQNAGITRWSAEEVDARLQVRRRDGRATAWTWASGVAACGARNTGTTPARVGSEQARAAGWLAGWLAS
jgi:glutamate dehydrogenase/leucine dehydrogenase